MASPAAAPITAATMVGALLFGTESWAHDAAVTCCISSAGARVSGAGAVLTVAGTAGALVMVAGALVMVAGALVNVAGMSNTAVEVTSRLEERPTIVVIRSTRGRARGGASGASASAISATLDAR